MQWRPLTLHRWQGCSKLHLTFAELHALHALLRTRSRAWVRRQYETCRLYAESTVSVVRCLIVGYGVRGLPETDLE